MLTQKASFLVLLLASATWGYAIDRAALRARDTAAPDVIAGTMYKRRALIKRADAPTTAPDTQDKPDTKPAATTPDPKGEKPETKEETPAATPNSTNGSEDGKPKEKDDGKPDSESPAATPDPKGTPTLTDDKLADASYPMGGTDMKDFIKNRLAIHRKNIKEAMDAWHAQLAKVAPKDNPN